MNKRILNSMCANIANGTNGTYREVRPYSPKTVFVFNLGTEKAANYLNAIGEEALKEQCKLRRSYFEKLGDKYEKTYCPLVSFLMSASSILPDSKAKQLQEMSFLQSRKNRIPWDFFEYAGNGFEGREITPFKKVFFDGAHMDAEMVVAVVDKIEETVKLATIRKGPVRFYTEGNPESPNSWERTKIHTTNGYSVMYETSDSRWEAPLSCGSSKVIAFDDENAMKWIAQWLALFIKDEKLFTITGVSEHSKLNRYAEACENVTRWLKDEYGYIDVSAKFDEPSK